MNPSIASGCNEPKNNDLLQDFLCLLQPEVTVSAPSSKQKKAELACSQQKVADTWSARQPERIYQFEPQLKKGKKAEAYFEDLAHVWIAQKRICKVEDVREIPCYRREDVDFICTLPNGRVVKFEVKGDSTNTGNMFVESHVPGYTLDEKGNIVERQTELGWLYKSKADYVFYCFTHPEIHKAYLMNMTKLAAWVDAMTLRCNFVHLSQKRSFQLRGAKNTKENDPNGSYYYGIGVIIPLKDVEAANHNVSAKERFLTIYNFEVNEEEKKEE